jgi:hypothetical protein
VIPVIAVGFCLLFGLLLWFVIGSRGRWTAKLAAIAVSSAFTFMVWDALDTFSGWPTQQSPPERALLVSSTVEDLGCWPTRPTSASRDRIACRSRDSSTHRLTWRTRSRARAGRSRSGASRRRRATVGHRGSCVSTCCRRPQIPESNNTPGRDRAQAARSAQCARTVAMSSTTSTGFETYPSKPAARKRSRLPRMA